MSKTLIYYIAFGMKHFSLAKNSIASLKKYGMYHGDIKIVTDIKENIEGVGSIIRDIIPVHSSLLRVYIRDYIDISVYSNIGYLDCDIIIMNDINFLLCIDGISLAEEHLTIKSQWNDINNTFYMQEEEKIQFSSMNCINSGQFFLSNPYYETFFDGVKNIISTNRTDIFGPDQSALNYYILKNNIVYNSIKDYVKFFGNSYSSKHDGCVINHFNGCADGKLYNEVNEICSGKDIYGIPVTQIFHESLSNTIILSNNNYSYGKVNESPWCKLMFKNGICHGRVNNNENYYQIMDNILVIKHTTGGVTNVLKNIDGKLIGYNFNGELVHLTENHWTQIHGCLNYGEIIGIVNVISDSIKKNNINILEIGTYTGRSSIALFTELRNKGITSFIDTCDIFKEGEYKNYVENNTENFAPSQSIVNSIISDFNLTEYIKTFKREHGKVELPINKTYDVVFIDGSHAYDDVLIDCKIAEEKLSNGGVIMGDDYCTEWYGIEVMKAVDEYFGKSNIHCYNGKQWMLLRK
jgi:hypothetical protein